jgi:hypothetical protein
MGLGRAASDRQHVPPAAVSDLRSAGAAGFAVDIVHEPRLQDGTGIARQTFEVLSTKRVFLFVQALRREDS